MFKFSKNHSSPRYIDQFLTQLIGPDETKVFWKKYLDNYITQEDIRYMKSLGMNTVRIPFHYKMLANEEYMGLSSEEQGFSYLDKIIGWCKEEKLWVILDMHCAPGGQTGDNIDDSWGYPWLFESETHQKKTVEVWHKIARRYKDEEIVMGYDLLNEPIAHYFDSSKFNHLLEPLYKRIVASIREVDKNHLVFLGGAQWNTNFNVFGPPFDSKLVYTFHLYWCDTTQSVVQKFVDFRDKYNVPIFIGETGENTDEWIKAFRGLLESNNIGWTFWPYKKMNNKKGILEFDQPEFYDELIKISAEMNSGFETVRKNRPEDISRIKKALDDFLTNSRLVNCHPNKGYIEALGLKGL